MFMTYGNTNKPDLLIIGDCPYGTEIQTQRPFAAAGSQILPIALHRYNIAFTKCFSMYLFNKTYVEYDSYITSVKKHGTERGWVPCEDGWVSQELLNIRQEILKLIDSLNPNCVLLCGELALWVVTGKMKLGTCRGSIYPSIPTPAGRIFKTVCTLSPASVQRQLEMEPIFERDIERAAFESKTPGYVEPEWNFLLQASAEEYLARLKELTCRAEHSTLPVKLAVDIETIRHEIACVGIAWSSRDAICVPIRTRHEYWDIETELCLIKATQRLLEHPNVRIVGQNFHYDAQYFTTKWGVVPRLKDDSMLAQHLLFPFMPKTLYFIASVYCDFYQYWKDDLKDYKKAPTDDNKFFAYNCRDCCYTFEAMEKLERLLEKDSRKKLYEERMSRLWWTILRMTLRGIRINTTRRTSLAIELMDAAQQRQHFLDEVIGYPFNPRSSPQMKKFFYEEMRVKAEKSRVRKVISLDSEILQKIPDNYPLLWPIVNTIIEMRSIGVFLSTFVKSELDFDGRMRCAFNMGGTITFRLSSSENAFGRGGNQQNIPKGDRARTRFKLPNIRELYLPDSGQELFDIDLAGADAQVVAWEANDSTMKQLFREKRKIAAFAAREIFGNAAGPDGKNEPFYTRAKMGGHATNYGAVATTVAKALGITNHEAERFQSKWFGVFPGVKKWQERIEHELQSRRYVENRFGYRFQFFGRTDKALPQALALVPQSTVAIVTNKAMDIIDTEFELARILLQVHDSIIFGLPIQRPEGYVEKLLSSLNIVIPYDDPLVIPFASKSSTISWGAC